MERAAKRLRLSTPDVESTSASDRPADKQVDLILKPILTTKETSTAGSLQSFPTLDVKDLQRHRLELRHNRPEGGVAMGVFPRAPEVTVTANVVHIAVLDGSDQTSYTQVTALASDVVVAISRVGVVTVSGVLDSTSSLSPSISTATPSTSSLEPSGTSTTGLISSSISSNGTTSTEHTVTVTAVSTLQVSVRNGTSTISSSTRQRTTFTTGDFTETLDSGSSTRSPTGFRFGDIISSSQISSSTNTYYGGAAVTATTSSGSETTSSSTGSGGGVVLTAQQQQVVGGVVGGVAGIALVLLGLLYFLKWYRHQLKSQGGIPEQRARHRQLPSIDGHDFASAPSMTQQSQTSFVPVAAFKQSLQKLRPRSANTLASNYTQQSSIPTSVSERGFQRVSGRKIPSVLLSGGDGYGEQRPVSPVSDYSAFSPSREVSQISSLRESGIPANPFLAPARTRSSSIYSTPSRAHVSPFLDPPHEDDDDESFQMTDITPRQSIRASKSQLSIRTAGLSVLNPIRQSDINVLIRPSPARTPTTTSPTTSSLRLPMHTPPMMSGDVPEMPTLHPSRYGMGPRSISAYSVRSTNSVGGKFKEDV